MNKKAHVDDGSIPLHMRGWLRLWIAVTIIWLIGLAAFAWMTWPPAPPPPGTWIPPAYAVPVPDRVRDALLHQREMVRLVAALAILPPVGMLLLAAMGRWVYRGFK